MYLGVGCPLASEQIGFDSDLNHGQDSGIMECSSLQNRGSCKSFTSYCISDYSALKDYAWQMFTVSECH